VALLDAIALVLSSSLDGCGRFAIAFVSSKAVRAVTAIAGVETAAGREVRRVMVAISHGASISRLPPITDKQSLLLGTITKRSGRRWPRRAAPCPWLSRGPLVRRRGVGRALCA